MGDERADRAAKFQGVWNAQRDALGHDGPAGAEWVDDRPRMQGVMTYAACSEIVCQGWPPTEGFPEFDWVRCLVAWLESKVGHREALLDPSWTHCGTSLERTAGGRPYGTAVFYR